MAAKSQARSRVCLTVLGLQVLLGTGAAWLTQATLTPQTAQAYKARVDVQLDRLRNETYQSMLRRAEIVARAAAQRSFDRDILASEVSIMVIGRNNGTETPLMLLEVSRQNWRERPDTRRWATYYRSAQTLLKLPSAGDPVIPNAAPPVQDNLPQIQPVPAPVPNVNVPVPAPVEATPVPVPSPEVVPAVPAAPQPTGPTPELQGAGGAVKDAARSAAEAAKATPKKVTPKKSTKKPNAREIRKAREAAEAVKSSGAAAENAAAAAK
jgi:hypothetical protein